MTYQDKNLFDAEIETIKVHLNVAYIKATDSAIEAYRIISNSQNPLTISQIKEKMEVQTHSATLYRILEKFVKAGLAKRLQFNEQKSLYEINKLPHNHFICENCNKVIDIYLKDEELQTAKNLVSKNYNVQVKAASINFTGRCKDC